MLIYLVYKPQQVLTKHYKSIILASFLYFYAIQIRIQIQLNKLNQKSFIFYDYFKAFNLNQASKHLQQ